MFSIYLKEIRQFFSSYIGYLVIGFFLVILGLMIWVFPDYSILDGNYASLAQLFELGPFLLTFLIPAITMKTFAEEKSEGTIEFLSTKPIKNSSIIGAKFLSSLTLVLMAILPTLLYVYSLSKLGSPEGNIDRGEIFGSYIGLMLLAASFTALGILASVLTNSQIGAFLVGVLLCFLMYWGLDLVSSLPIFFAKGDLLIQSLGIDSHYRSMSRGLLMAKDVVYFISLITLILVLTNEGFNWSKH